MIAQDQSAAGESFSLVSYSVAMARDLDATDTESFDFESEAPTPPSPVNSLDGPFNEANPADYAIVPAPAPAPAADQGVGKGGGRGVGRGRGPGRGRGAPKASAKGKAKAKAKAKAAAGGIATAPTPRGYWRVVRDALTNSASYQPRIARYELCDEASGRLLFQGYQNDPTFKSIELPAFDYIDQFAEDFIEVKSRFASSVKVHKFHDAIENERDPNSSSSSSLRSRSPSTPPLPGLFRLVTCC